MADGGTGRPALAWGCLKICMVVEAVHAGVGRHLVDLICALSRRGHHVHLIYSPRRIDPEFLAAIAQQKNVRCDVVRMSRSIRLEDLRSLFQIWRIIKTHGPYDVIHGHSSKGGAFARLLKLSFGTPVLYTPHAFVTQGFQRLHPARLFFGAIEAALAVVTDRIICTSNVESDHASALGIARTRLAVIQHGVPRFPAPDRSEVRARLKLRPEQMVVGFIGRMNHQKAPERLVAAALRALRLVPHLTLLMIGEGPLRPQLESEMRTAGLAERVLWLGEVEARVFLPAMDAFALTSRYEGFPYVLLEALQMALPIIVTPVGGAVEAVGPGVNGFIVSHDEPGQLADAMIRLATDDGLRRAMSQASRRRADKFHASRMLDAHENLYLEVSAARSAPAHPPVPASVGTYDQFIARRTRR